jgi:hypothetical protein
MSELKRIYEGLHTVAEASEGPYKPALRAWVTKLSDMLPNRTAVLHVDGAGQAQFSYWSTDLITLRGGVARLDGTFTLEQLLAIYEHLKEKS